MTIAAIIEGLKKPMPYEWRIQSFSKDRTKAICTAYIDARQVMNRLDEVCQHGWGVWYHEIAGFIFADITVYDENGTRFTRSDCGNRIVEDKNDNMYEQAGKSSASDALKRAAVAWGVGRFIYDTAPVTVNVYQNRRPLGADGQPIRNLTSYINNLQVKRSAAPEPAPKAEVAKEPVAPAAATPPQAPVKQAVKGKPALTEEKLQAMADTINAGDHVSVEKAMNKYALTESQKLTLTRMINMKKAKAALEGTKK